MIYKGGESSKGLSISNIIQNRGRGGVLLQY